MEVIPAINCEDVGCVQEKLARVRELGSPWVHFDVTDGHFTKPRTWNDPAVLKDMGGGLPKIEVHLMVDEPEEFLGAWVGAGARRVLLHVESIRDSEELTKFHLDTLELGVVVLPKTPVSEILPYINGEIARLGFVQFLAVPPGPSGQTFDVAIVDKIKELLAAYPGIVVEVDGGITPETAKLVSDAGASVVVSSSYVWEHEDAKKALKELEDV